MPEISVIIPLYNKAKYIGRTLDSVLGQSFTDYEVIIINDGSTDNGPEIISRDYKDPRIKIVNQSNSGPGAARNHGIKIAKGQYIAFIDGDDQWQQRYLENQHICLSQNKECALSVCRMYVNSTDNLWVGDNILKDNAGIWQLSVQDSYEQMNQMLAAWSPGNTFWRKEILNKYNGFYENRALIGEDQYLMVQVMLNHKIFINENTDHIYHFEASGLVKNRKCFRPLILDPNPARENCPVEFKDKFEFFLNSLAFKECCGLIWPSTIKDILAIRDRFPEMDKTCRARFPKKYVKLKLKLPIYPFINYIMSSLGSRSTNS